MINLLLPENKKRLIAEYHQRVVLIYLLSLVGLLIVALVVLGSFYLSLVIEKKSLTDSGEISSKKLNTEDLVTYSGNVTRVNKMINLLTTNRNQLHQVTEVIARVIDARPEGIKVTSLSVGRQDDSRWAVAIQGISSQRKNIINFINSLEKDPLFSTVDSPFSNLIKDGRSDFTMIVFLSSELKNSSHD